FRLFLEERSGAEIGAALGISEQVCFKRIQRARKIIRPQLAGHFFGSETAGAGGGRRGGRPALGAVERALTEIVSSCRIVTIALPTGGECQLCLRVDREQAARETDIEPRRARLAGRPRAWKQRLQLAELCDHSGRWAEAKVEYRAVLAANPSCHA